MTRPEDYLAAVQAIALERKHAPISVDRLTDKQLRDLNTARLMGMTPADCELLLQGQPVPPRGER